MATQVKTGLIANDAITDAKIANVALTGVTASSGDSSTSLATTAFVATEINSLIDSAPGALNTLNELAAAMGDDANFSTTVTNSIATKLPLAGGTLTGDLVLKSDGGSDVINVVHSGNTVQLVSIGQSSDNSGNGVIQLKRNNGVLHSQIHSHGSTYFNGGSVGIGFASGTPGRKLHIKDGGQIKLESSSSGGWVGLDFAAGNGTYDGYMGMLDSNGRFFIDVDSNGEDLTILQNGNVGIGTSNPAGQLHVYSGDAGAVTPSSQADDLVVENSAEGGITIMTPDDQSARIRFTSPSTESGDEGGADIFYRQNINKMSLGTTVSGGKLAFKSGAGVETMILDNGNVGIGVTPAAWYGNASALQISPTGALYNTSNWEDLNLGNNVYINSSGTDSYIQADAACKIRLTDAGLMDFRVAGAGSANAAISWNTAIAINSSGQVLVGGAPGAWVDGNDILITHGRGIFKGFGHSALALGRYNSGGTAGEAGSMLAFLYGGAGIGTISITTNSTQYNTTSDIRLKENIQTIVDGSSKIMAMNPVSHTWKANPTEDAVHGFIAQEIKDIVPEAVTGEPEGEEMMQMDYGRITPVIVAGLQDALKEIEKLKERINELENK